METSKGHIDVAKSIRVIEWLKAELVGSVASLLRSMVNGGGDAIADCLAGIMMIAYILGKRVGVAHTKVDQRLKEKVSAGIRDGHEIEEWYGDLTSLLGYLEGRKR